MKLVFILPLLFLPLVFNCSQPVLTGPSDIPNMVKPSDLPDPDMFFRLPSAISYSGQTSGEVVQVLAKRNSSLQNLSAAPIFEIYGVVPTLVHYAEAYKIALAEFIRGMAEWEIIYNGTVEHDIWTIETVVRDTVVSGENFDHFNIAIYENGEMVLAMDYFKNSTGGFRGSFFYFNNSISEYGNAVWMNFNNLNPLQEEMQITFYNPIDSLVDGNQPSIVRYTAIRREEMITLQGFAYLPIFYDNFLGEGPKFYVFNAATRSDRNSAVVNVAFAGTEEIYAQNLFGDYSLGEVLLRRAVYAIRDSLRVNSGFARAFLWSVETEQAIEESRYAEIALYTPEGTVDEIGIDDLTDFLELNPNLRSANRELQNFFDFIRTRQPVFFDDDGTFEGDYDDLLPEDLEDLGLEIEDIEDFVLDFEVIERVRTYSPERAMYEHWME